MLGLGLGLATRPWYTLGTWRWARPHLQANRAAVLGELLVDDQPQVAIAGAVEFLGRAGALPTAKR
ncbi:hypothetical protein D3C80_2147160 [compost metagenome]